MKLSFAFLAFLLFASCSNNTTPGTNNNTNTGSGQFGADYLPLTDNTVLTGHATGSVSYIDTNGNITRTDQVDRDFTSSIGFVETRSGQSVHPVYAFDADGNSSNNGNPVAFAGTLDSEVFALNEFSNPSAATILPRVLPAVGQSWTPAAAALPIQCQATLAQHLANYTDKGGTSYNDVIDVHATYFDTAGVLLFGTYQEYSPKYTASADFYFANGVGLVEADVHSYESFQYFYDYNTGKLDELGNHKKASGTVWRKN